MNKEENISNPEIISLHLLKVKYENNWHLAFNEICIGGDMSSWIDFSVDDKDEQIEDFKGSGIIVSTAQGSTGINKNNGGVILPLTSNNWVITGDKTNRKIHYVLEPQNLTIKIKSRKPFHIWCDGKTFLELSKDEKHIIQIEQSDKIVQIMFNDVHEFKRKRK
jgi:NAD kinase